MAFRSTGSKLMAGVSRSKDFRLTLEQLRIYKKVWFQKQIWTFRCCLLLSAMHTSKRSFVKQLCFVGICVSTSLTSFLSIFHAIQSMMKKTKKTATQNESKSMRRCYDETAQCPRGLRRKSLVWNKSSWQGTKVASLSSESSECVIVWVSNQSDIEFLPSISVFAFPSKTIRTNF
jgi:hypothetical protein